jgi:hypothetical protein
MKEAMILKNIWFMSQKWIHTVKESLAISQYTAREGNPHVSSYTDTAGPAPAGPLISNFTFDPADIFFFLFKFEIRDSL